MCVLNHKGKISPQSKLLLLLLVVFRERRKACAVDLIVGAKHSSNRRKRGQATQTLIRFPANCSYTSIDVFLCVCECMSVLLASWKPSVMLCHHPPLRPLSVPSWLVSSYLIFDCNGKSDPEVHGAGSKHQPHSTPRDRIEASSVPLSTSTGKIHFLLHTNRLLLWACVNFTWKVCVCTILSQP